MKNLALLILLLSHFLIANAQSDECKVLMESIAGEYQGDCLNGLANGKGKSKGIDSYKGFFKDGLPDGMGTYTYKNGDVYKGEWAKGLKNGKGEFKYTLNNKSLKLVGYWENGEYKGTSDPEKNYRVLTTLGITDYTIEEKESGQKVIRLIMKNAMTDFMPIDLKLNSSSGQIMTVGKRISISDYFCPYNLDVSYTIRTGSGIRKQFRFLIEINNPGYYTITLVND